MFKQLAFIYLFLLNIKDSICAISDTSYNALKLSTISSDVEYESTDFKTLENQIDIGLNNDEIMLVGTVDGYIHAVDSSNQRKWSITTGGSMVSSHQKNNDINLDSSIDSSSKLINRDYSIIPAVDGSLLVHNSGGMRKTSVKARMLAEKTPFASVDGELFFTGERKTKVFGLDVENGKITHEFNMDTGVSTQVDTTTHTDDTSIDKKKSPLWIGRIDYSVRAFDGSSGVEQFNFSYAEFRQFPRYSSRLSTHESAIMKNHKIDNMITTRSSKTKFINNVHANDVKTIGLPADTVTKVIKSNPILYSAYDDLIVSDIDGKFQSVRLDSPVMAAFLVKPQNNNEYTVENLEVNSDTHPLDDSSSDERVKSIEIRSNKDGGLYAINSLLDKSNSYLLNCLEDEDSAECLEASQAFFQQQSSSMNRDNNIMKKLLDKPVTANKNLLSLHSARLKLGNSKTSASVESEHALHLDTHDTLSNSKQLVNTNSNKHCVVYPQMFKYDIDSETTQILQRSKEEDFAVCLLGKHNLLPTQGQDQRRLPFLDDDFIDITSLPNSQSMSGNKTSNSLMYQFMLLYSNYLLSFFIISVIWIVMNWDYIAKYYKKLMILRDINDDTLLNITNYNNSLQPVNLISTISSPETSIQEVYVNGVKSFKIGSLIMEDRILGYGSQGTVVFSGNLNGRPVAIKRMLSQFSNVAEREMNLLIRSDGHPNVVRYFLKEVRQDFIYLALQLCTMSLRDFIVQVIQSQKHSLNNQSTCKSTGIIPDEVRLGLSQIIKGVSHLHANRIVHRDLKPHNILCALPDEIISNGSNSNDSSLNSNTLDVYQNITSLTQINNFILKISDMGLSKQIDRDDASISVTHHHLDKKYDDSDDEERGYIGSIGWQAPELCMLKYIPKTSETLPGCAESIIAQSADDVNSDIMDEDYTDESSSPSPYSSNNNITSTTSNKTTRNVDIFSLGCVFHFILIPGCHPFGTWHEREVNIMNNKSDMSKLQVYPDAYDLIDRMLRPNPLDRPSAYLVNKHPFFWTSQIRLDFLIELSDRLEHETPDSNLVLAIESNSSEIIGTSWDKRLHSSLLDDIGKYRKYDKSCVRDLLRLIRNKKHHFHELDDQLKAMMSPIPSNFISYFESRFPKLLIHCVKVACVQLANDKHFVSIFQDLSLLFTERVTNADRISACITVPTVNDNNSQLDTNANYDDFSVTSSDSMTTSETSQTETLTNDQSMTRLADQNILVWYGSSLAEKLNCRGWLRDVTIWENGTKFGSSVKSGNKARPSHLIKASTDFRYRSRLCSHWESTHGTTCPIRKKGKCDFAHGPLELRVKDTRRDKWGKVLPHHQYQVDNFDYYHSGGEDVLGSARAGTGQSSSNSFTNSQQLSNNSYTSQNNLSSPNSNKYRTQTQNQYNSNSFQNMNNLNISLNNNSFYQMKQASNPSTPMK